MPELYDTELGWHEGESKVQNLLHVPLQVNPTSSGLSPHASRLCKLSSLLALGTIDDEGRPWTTLLSGEAGFIHPLGQSLVGLTARISSCYDPVIELLSGDGHRLQDVHNGRPMAALGLHLATRDRVKLNGSVVAFTKEEVKSVAEERSVRTVECQMVLSIHGSMGNCPKYINKKSLLPRNNTPLSAENYDQDDEQEQSLSHPHWLSKSTSLSVPSLNLLSKADMFFISASVRGSNMSTNHRGGSPGFVRIAQNDNSGVTLVYPEFSGNRYYQTLGNLFVTPKAGLVFPDFDTGDVLYMTGTTQILFGKDAAAVLPRSNVAVKIHLDSARFVPNGLSFRGRLGERSPYNPPVRYLSSERSLPDVQAKDSKTVYIKLIARDVLTPSIARLKFSVSDPEAAGRWKPGQYVAMAFEDELSLGYSHMNDDDPTSLNDDYVRTWTVSSPPGRDQPHAEFEITIRNVGVVTNFLFRQNIRAELEVPLKGFGGSFVIKQDPGGIVPFIAGGIGITPLLGQIPDLDLKRLKLLWTLNASDIGLAVDTFERCPLLASATRLFITHSDVRNTTERKNLEKLGAQVVTRRLLASDIEKEKNCADTWYLCTGTSLRKSLLEWLRGKTTVYEDFDY